MKERKTLIISAVRRSQCFECSEKPKVWDTAVFPISGTFGRRAFVMGIGLEVSILAGTLRKEEGNYGILQSIK